MRFVHPQLLTPMLLMLTYALWFTVGPVSACFTDTHRAPRQCIAFITAVVGLRTDCGVSGQTDVSIGRIREIITVNYSKVIPITTA